MIQVLFQNIKYLYALIAFLGVFCASLCYWLQNPIEFLIPALIFACSFYFLNKMGRIVLSASALLGALLFWPVFHPAPLLAPAEFAGVLQVRDFERKGLDCVLDLREATQNQIYKTKVSPCTTSVLYSGDWVRVQGEFKTIPANTTPGVFDYQDYLLKKGYSAYLKVPLEGITFTEKSDLTWMRYPQMMRAHLAQQIQLDFSPYCSGLLRALLLGLQSDLDSELSQDFKNSGLFHLLAISGMHVVILSLMLEYFFHLLRLPRRASVTTSLIIVWIYALITAFTPPVARAALAYTIFALAMLKQEKHYAMQSLGWAGFIIFCLSPQELFLPSFLLSFMAAFFILYYHNIFYKPAQSKFGIVLQESIVLPTAITLYATLGTAPILVSTFHQMAPVAFLGNIVAVPATTGLMISSLIALLLSGLPILAHPFVVVSEALAALLAPVAHFCANLSWSQVAIASPSRLFWVFYYAFLLMLPWVFLRKKWSYTPFLILAMVGLIFWGKWFYQRHYVHQLAVTYVDVGQGDATFIRTPNHQNILVDAGNKTPWMDFGARTLVPFLHSEGINQLDALILTHPDQDHIGGAFSLMEQMPILAIYINKCDLYNPKENWQAILHKAREHKIPVIGIDQRVQWKNLGGPTLKVLYPLANGICSEDANDNSLVLSLKWNNIGSLLIGDLEKPGEEQLLASGTPLKHQYLKGGHHGSRTSSPPEFVNAVNPDITFLSYGAKNRYHHPHSEALIELQKTSTVYSTAKNGSLRFSQVAYGWDLGWMWAKGVQTQVKYSFDSVRVLGFKSAGFE